MREALVQVLTELLEGAASRDSLMLNPDDPGLFRSLASLSAGQASALPANGGASIAAHVDHLRYGLEMLNRWSRGEDPPNDYSASWTRTAVSEEQWQALQRALRGEALAWRDAIAQPSRLAKLDLAPVVASVAHLGYHFGAIRQIDRSIKGPAARD
jgi:hypothetical protein